MSSHYEAPIRKPLVLGDKSYHDVTKDIASTVEGKANKLWWIVFGISLSAFLWGVGCIIYTISTGIGVWGMMLIFYLKEIIFLLLLENKMSMNFWN